MVGNASGRLHIEQLLAVGGAEGIGGFQHFPVHQADAEAGQTDDGRNGVDHHCDQARYLADAENHHHGDEINEAWQGLHHVEHRIDDTLQPFGASHQNAERQADDDGDQRGDGDDGKRRHGVAPEADCADHEQGDGRATGDLEAAPGQMHDRQNDQHGDDPRGLDEQPLRGVEEELQRMHDHIDRIAVIAHDIAKTVIDGLACYTHRGVVDCREFAEQIRQVVAEGHYCCFPFGLWAEVGVRGAPPLSCRTSPPQGGRLIRGKVSPIKQVADL